VTSRSLRNFVRADPHLPLAVTAAVLLTAEWHGLDRPLAWQGLEAFVAGLGLLLAWQRRDRLRLPPLLALCCAFQIAWILVHLHLGTPGDPATRLLYAKEGRAVLDGGYPRSPYPPGAVGLFAVEAWLGGGGVRASSAFAMVPFQLLCVAGVWALRTRWSPWLAACVALWPANLFFWEFRFDLVPTASVVAGVALASRDRWRAAGLVLGLGALVKWTPGLTTVALVVWLVFSGRRRLARQHLLAFAIPVVLVYVPLLLWRPAEALAPYRAQSGRAITGESLPYLPLRLFGLARPGRHFYGVATVPGWASGAAIALQVLALGAVFALLIVVRNRNAALALAALAPAVFLLTNRIFSPQFFVLIMAACAVAAALVIRESRELLALAATLGAATVANAILFPGLAGRLASPPGWTYASAAALVLASTAATWLIVRAARSARQQAVDARVAEEIEPRLVGHDRRVLAGGEAPDQTAGGGVQRVRPPGERGEVDDAVDHGGRPRDRSVRVIAPDQRARGRVECVERVVVGADEDASVPDGG
jgi:hypothetical protein